jgi:hypothetical protein
MSVSGAGAGGGGGAAFFANAFFASEVAAAAVPARTKVRREIGSFAMARIVAPRKRPVKLPPPVCG